MSIAVTAKAFSEKVKSVADLYDTLLRNGYHLPRLKSSLVTEGYLIGVMNQVFWCP